MVPSDNEGFGLVAVEALGCDVPVLSTPVGIAPTLLRPRRLARRHLDAADARIRGRARADWFSAELMAGRVLVAYREPLDADDQTGDLS
jgi:glycosyltransferase involved in cell wall biosynthesis